MSLFDNRAKDWDKNQMHLMRSEAIANELVKIIPISDKMSALEYGAGTGLLSFILKDKFARITMMDNSREMIRVTEAKIVESGNLNMNALQIDLEKEDYQGQFDIVYNQMVLHHVENIDLIISKFYALLNPDGYLAIADLYLEDGTFHDEAFTGHKGFDVDLLSKQLEGHHFKDVNIQPCFVVQRDLGNGEFKEFPIFLLTAQKA